MTRKDYILIAGAVSTVVDNYPKACHPITFNGVREAAYSLADVLGRDNPAFDRGRFLKACGVMAV